MTALSSFPHRSLTILSLAASVALGACATCPNPAQVAKPDVPVTQPAPTPAPTQESLLAFVPPQSIAALVVRKNLFSEADAYFKARPDLQRELSELLANRIGIDFTQVEGVVAYLLGVKEDAVAVLIRLSMFATVIPKLEQVGVHQGVAMYKLEHKVFLSVLPGGVVIGTELGVRAAIDHSRAAVASATDGILAVLEKDARDADLGLAVRAVPFGAREVDRFVTEYGIRHGSFTLDAQRVLTVRLKGDGKRLGAVVDLIKASLAFALSYLEIEKNKALGGSDIYQALGTIVGVYEAKRLFKDIEPVLAGDEITSRYQNTASMGGAAAVGVLAAIAIPAYSKYLKNARQAAVEDEGAAMKDESKSVAKPSSRRGEGKVRRQKK